MSANRRPRKQYRPKSCGLPITFGLSAESRTNLQLPPHMLLDAMLAGQGDETAAHTLIAAVNLGAVLSRSQSQESQEVMNDGLRAVASVKDRGEQSQKWGVSGDEYRAIGAALVLSGDMQGDMRRKDLRTAVETVYREAT